MRLFQSVAVLAMSTIILQAGGKDTSPPSSSVVPVEESGFYLGGGFGSFALHNTDANEKLSAYGGTIIAGYQFNSYLSIEGRYTRSSKLTYSKESISKSLDSTYTDTALFARLGYPVGSFTPYALLGYGANRITNLAGADRVEYSIQYGAGISFKASQNLSLFADYIIAYDKKGFGDRATAEHQHINLATIGLIYKF